MVRFHLSAPKVGWHNISPCVGLLKEYRRIDPRFYKHAKNFATLGSMACSAKYFRHYFFVQSLVLAVDAIVAP
jgi:hypothetical protein